MTWKLNRKLNQMARDMRAKVTPLQEFIEQTVELRAQAKRNQDSELEDIANFVQFVLLAHKDVAFLVADVYESRDSDRKCLYLRFLALTLFEFLDDLQVLLNNKFRARVDKIFSGEHFQQEFRKICKHCNKIRESHEEMLRKVRNAVVAHRHHDGICLPG